MFTTALFDLDGTLTNPYIGITNSVIYALEHLRYPVPEREQLKPFIGPPLIESFTKLCKMDENTATQAVKLYREYFSQRGLFENELIVGAEQLLSSLTEKGVRICLATSKPRPFSERILEHFHITHYFDYIGASTLDGSINHKHEVIKLVLDNTGACVEECLMIGDRLHDIEGAHKFAMKCCAVLCGFGTREEFAEYKADFIVDTLAEVKKYF